MKKTLILTSVLALAACGGGSGGGVGAPVRSAITADSTVAQSNSAITSMASEILVASDGTTLSPSLNRSASMNYNGKTYTSYRLDDVTFKFGGEDSQVKFELDNNGQIIALGKYDRSDDFTGEPTYALSQEGRFVRTSSTDNKFAKNLYVYGYHITPEAADTINLAENHFDGDLQVMADTGDLSDDAIKAKIKASINRDINKIKASQPDHSHDDDFETARAAYLAQVDAMGHDDFHMEVVDANLTVEGVNIGLKYADLGFAELMVKADPNDADDDAIEHTFTPYVGGYDAVKINPSQLANGTIFTGTAIAGIDHKRSGYADNKNVKEGVLVRQDNAKLTMNTDGSSSLLMDNLVRADDPTQHWYTVRVDKAAGTGDAKSGLPTFTISGTNTITGKHDYDGTNGDGIKAYDLPSGIGSVTFTDNHWKDYEQEYVDSSDNNYRLAGVAETNVYGINTDDMEATSRFSFSNEYHSDDNHKHNEVAIYGAFGGNVDTH